MFQKFFFNKILIVGQHKRKYIEASLNPESFVSHTSSLQLDAFLGVPHPLSSSKTVVSNLDHFEPPAQELSDLDVDEVLIGKQASNTAVDTDGLDYSTIFCQCDGGLLSPPMDRNIDIYNSQVSSSTSGTSAVAEALLQLGNHKKPYCSQDSSLKNVRSTTHTDAVSDPLDISWRPQVERAHMFDVSILAPKSIFYGDRFPREGNSSKVQLGVSKPKVNKQPIDEIIAVVRTFEYTMWPEFSQGVYNTYVESNNLRTYMHCMTTCAVLGEGRRCRFWVYCVLVRGKDGRDAAQISSCFLTHDCRSAASIEFDVKNNIKQIYRSRNTKLKYVVHASTFLRSFYKKPDITQKNGITADQLTKSVENEGSCIPLTKSQAFSFIADKNRHSWDVHTQEFTLLPDFFLKLIEADPDGLYVLNLLPVEYSIPGIDSSILKGSSLMFEFSICIPSACKHFYEQGMMICVVDGAHLYGRYEGVILSFATKDGEGHIVFIGFAIVPKENKYYWQIFMNAVFYFIRKHNLLISDKTKGLEAVKDLIINVSAKVREANRNRNVQEMEIFCTVYAQCVIHCSRNAKIFCSQLRSLCVQWAKCASDEDASAKIIQLQDAKISTAGLEHLMQNWKDITYLGLNATQCLESNYEVVSTNLGEQNHSRIRELRCMPILHLHKEYLADTAGMFTKRYSEALSYQTQGKLVVPDVLKKTVDGAEYLKCKGWSISISGTVTSTGSAGSATSVKYCVSKLNDSGSLQMYTVTLTNNDQQEWHKNIICKCNRTKAYGRPCYHASLCLVNPPTSDCNAFARDPLSYYYGRPCWYSSKYLVSTMIEQYSKPVILPSFKKLRAFCIFPPMIFKLPGNIFH